MHIGQPLIRGLRALVFAVACVAVTAALHFAAGGALISFESVRDRHRGPDAPLAYGLGGSQRGLGVLTDRLRARAVGPARCGSSSALRARAARWCRARRWLLAHALAMGVTALWLARGDAALAAFLDLLVLAFGPGLLAAAAQSGAARSVPPRRLACRLPTGSARSSTLLASAVPRRGPPVPLGLLSVTRSLDGARRPGGTVRAARRTDDFFACRPIRVGRPCAPSCGPSADAS